MRCSPALAPLLLTACDTPATTRDEEAARAAAEQWLARNDNGDYGGAWQDSTPALRIAMSKQDWEANQARLYRAFGVPDGRELVAAKYTPWVPGGEPGEYVLIQYRREISAGGTILETMSMKRAGEGWRTASYHIMPTH